MEPVPIPDGPGETRPPATNLDGTGWGTWGAATGADDYLIFFLSTLGIFYSTVALLNKPDILASLETLRQSGWLTRYSFGLLCSLVVLGSIAVMETILQRLVPTYYITSWGIIISSVFTSMMILALRLFTRDTWTTARLSSALFLMVLPVEALHFYLIGNFRRYFPLPVLYGVTPLILMAFLRNYLENSGIFPDNHPQGNPELEKADDCSCGDERTEEQCFTDDCNWAKDFDDYRRLGRSEQQRLENLALRIDPEFGAYHWDPRAAVRHEQIYQRDLHRTLTASADNYVVFFLAGLGAYHGAINFLSDPKVLQFLRELSCAGLYQQLVFASVACLLAGAWLVALEYGIQILVPQFQISNLAGIPVLFLVVCGLGMMSLYVQDNFIVARLAAAILMPMLQVAALHFYVISEFRQCIPLPMLYILIPSVLAVMIWNHLLPTTGRSGPGAGPGDTARTARLTKSPPTSRRRTVTDYRENSQAEPEYDYNSFKWSHTDHPLFRTGQKFDDENG